MANNPYIELLNDPNLFTRYEETAKGKKVIPSPLEYDELMRVIPRGKLITTEELNAALAARHKADYTDQRATTVHIIIVANASKEKELLGGKNVTPYWRTLKKTGELNERYPGGVAMQKSTLESEGHIISRKGKKLYVKGYLERLFTL